ncbi:MOSC domain-containing protein [Actinomycetaceae bacterium L2_0104]
MIAAHSVFDDELGPVRDGFPRALGAGAHVGEVLAVCVVHRLHPDPGTVGVTAIDKRAVEGQVKVTKLSLYGDVQADRKHHGGVDQALYAIAQEEMEHWERELGRPFAAGQFGENLRIAGPLDALEIGARVRVGGVLLEATGTRNPCSTFARWVGHAAMVKEFSRRENAGVYFKVVKTGRIGAGDTMEVVSTPGHGVSCARWYRYQNPSDARRLLQAHESGNVSTREPVGPAAEQVALAEFQLCERMLRLATTAASRTTD